MKLEHTNESYYNRAVLKYSNRDVKAIFVSIGYLVSLKRRWLLFVLLFKHAAFNLRASAVAGLLLLSRLSSDKEGVLDEVLTVQENARIMEIEGHESPYEELVKVEGEKVDEALRQATCNLLTTTSLLSASRRRRNQRPAVQTQPVLPNLALGQHRNKRRYRRASRPSRFPSN
jgi:hypothetical protein